MTQVYDLLGVGFGPANISLAIACEEKGFIDRCLFLDQSPNPVWQEQMLFEESLDIHSNIQNIPYRDLVTPRNPRSKYTFLNYLHESGRFFEHLNMDLLLPMRPDYATYINWIASHFTPYLKTNVDVCHVGTARGRAEELLFRIVDKAGAEYLSHNVVIATGRPPYIPESFKDLLSARVAHLSRYKSMLPVVDDPRTKRVAVVGSSQSAVEILLHINDRRPDIELCSIFRRFGYPLKDTNPFMSEIYFPQFTDFYFNADRGLRRRIDRDIYRTNYGACDMDVLEELYRRVYYEKLHGRENIRIQRLMDVLSAEKQGDNAIALQLKNAADGSCSSETFDLVILATGFRNIGTGERDMPTLPILSGLAHIIDLDDAGCLQVTRDYEVKLAPDSPQGGGLFLSGLCEATHGMGDAGSLSLVSLRAERITNLILEKSRLTPKLPHAIPYAPALALSPTG
ncbi:SidA/IucD/PvdA family monooxygenase [uncultured Bradyrhizobium sp.]|uniref:SidA/IucD/PvdA family monooxygenase n=1 Tax=uncultured Bradyrhizobium sp. TaxID=199684 RepID=UPI0035C943A9